MPVDLSNVRTIDEVLAIEDIATRIEYLKLGRKTPIPDVSRLYDEWDPKRHEIITNLKKYPKIKITTEPEQDVFDETTGKTVHVPAKTKEVEPNRIALPLEQDIINIQTAFTVGTEPKMTCEPNDDKEKGLMTTLKKLFRQNKLKYQNRKIVRAWLGETDVAEYWYVVKDDGFWAKVKAKIAAIFGKTRPEYKLKSQVWSPFRGDVLYPFFDESGDMVAFSRAFKKKSLQRRDIDCFMTITQNHVYQWELTSQGWALNPTFDFDHKFPKLPVIYAHRKDSYCDKIQPIRVRLEKCLSGYADCIDYHFFPILMLFGELQKMGGDIRNRIAQLTGEGANAQYLTWNQSSDPVKTEIETYFNQAYALTNTPRISFDQLKGTGNALSGVSFRYVFMAAHMAVENHGEVLGDFFQRRVNFLVSAVGAINPTLKAPADTIDVDVELVPFMIDDVDGKVSTAVEAVSGGIWSTEHGIVYASDYGDMQDELQAIKDEQKEKDAAANPKPATEPKPNPEPAK